MKLIRSWPALPLLAWLGCWSIFAVVKSAGGKLWLAAALACALGAAMAIAATTPTRRLIVAGGFPVSLVASGLGSEVPAWAWLAPLGLLLFVYPLRAWRDAPIFPTPARALQGLAATLPLPASAAVLDAGCGAGAALRELRREYPEAALSGVEWSWPLTLISALRCRDARIRRGDLWRADWSGYDLVYLFQRPESLARALAKAAAEMRAGSWLASLEFAAADIASSASFACVDGRTLHLYRLPLAAAATTLSGRRRDRKRR